MASFGHLAIGLMAGRLHEDGRVPPARPRVRARTMLVFALLGILPDADVLLVSMGVAESGAGGHRGASHSLFTALMIGIAAGLLARRYGWNGLRTALAVTLAVGSHGLLDIFGQGGRAIPLFWPFSAYRFIAPWRCLPDAPRGMQFISRHGFVGAALEFVYFLPATIYALWPRRPAEVPQLAVVDGGAGAAAARVMPPASLASGLATERKDATNAGDDETSLRSHG